MTINLIGNSGTDNVRSIVPFSSSQSNNHDSLASRVLNYAIPVTQRRALIIILVVLIWFYTVLLLIHPLPLKEHKSTIRTTKALTVVINTFKRPPKIVQDAIEFYAACDIVKHVYVIWSEKQLPPSQLTSKFNAWKTPTVTFQIQSTDSLNNRFKPLDGPHTDGIFAVDDDMRVPCEDLSNAFEVWMGSSRSLVGYMPRIHIRSKSGLVYRCWWRVWWHGVYSIILTKAAILHHDYFNMYTNVMPQSVRNLVDRSRNCEDIAMQFLISNHTGLPPIYVKAHIQDLGVFSGISTSKNVATAGHMDSRSKCLNALTSIYGKVPLVVSHTVVDSASNSWSSAPSTWWEYVSSDLWKYD